MCYAVFPSFLSPEPKLSEPATHLAPKPDRSRRVRRETQRAKSERNFRLFNMLKAGAPMTEIARQEGLSVRRARTLISAILASREIDPPPGFLQAQVGRLNDAMMIAHSAMMSGNLQAVDRVVRLVNELNRYHGFGRAEALAAARAQNLPPSEPAPRALPSPGETPAKPDETAAIGVVNP
jgi:DNA-binding CsgD family transcriptional regulator